MSTRGLSETRIADEDAINDLYILTFTDDELTDIHEVAIATDLSPVEDADNQYSITNWTIPTGDHRIVMLANVGARGATGGVQIGNVIWANANLDTYRTFAASETDYGRMYQFGSAAMPDAGKVIWPGKSNAAIISASNPGKRWSDGADVATFNYPTAWSNSGGWTSANNPCPEGWTVPSRDQWQNLLDNTTNITGLDVINGVQGRTFVSRADNSVYLFLPVSGDRRNTTGALNNADRGHYWGSSPDGAVSTNGLFLYYIRNTQAGLAGYPTNYAMAIRCVRSAEPAAGVAELAVGQSLADVRALFEVEIEGKMYETDGHVPMWGEAATVADAPASISVALRRAIARIDVGVGAFNESSGTWAGLPGVFEMTSVTLIAPNNKYSVIPELDADGVPLAPSVPTSATAFSLADSQSLFTYSGAHTAAEIYVPEAEITSVAHESRMALVIGGLYGTDTDPTYYRVDFQRNDGTLLDVLRNHLYCFSITSVSNRGFADAETAYNSVRSAMTTTVVGWGEVEFPTEL